VQQFGYLPRPDIVRQANVNSELDGKGKRLIGGFIDVGRRFSIAMPLMRKTRGSDRGFDKSGAVTCVLRFVGGKMLSADAGKIGFAFAIKDRGSAFLRPAR